MLAEKRGQIQPALVLDDRGGDQAGSGGRRTVPALLRTRVACYVLLLAAAVLALEPVFLAGESGVPGSLLLFLAMVLVNVRSGRTRVALVTTLVGALSNLVFGLALLSVPGTPVLVVSLQIGFFEVAALSIIGLAERWRSAQSHQQYYAELLGAIADDPQDGVCALDGAGRVTYISPTAEQVLGWGAAELLGNDLHQTMHLAGYTTCSTERSEPCSLLAIFRPGSTVQTGETELTARDGATVHVTYTAAPIVRAGRQLGVALRFRDIAEHTRAIDALRESEERYRSLVETAPDGIILTDLHGYITMANQRATQLYGYPTPTDLLGRRAIELVAPEDRQRTVEHCRSVLATGSVGTAEYTALMRDGETFPVEIRVSLLKQNEAGPEALIYACTDISDRRRTEETLRTSEICTTTQSACTLALAQSLTVGEALSNVLRSLGESAQWDSGMVWMLDTRHSILHCQCQWHSSSLDATELEEVSRQLSLEKGADLPGRVWAAGAPVWIRDIVSDTPGRMQFAPTPRAPMAAKAGLHTVLCLPVFVHGAVQGVVELFTRDVREPSDDLLQTIVTVTAQLGQFIERKEAEQALEYQSRHDALTNLPNRVLLQERMERALNATHGQDSSVALLLLDLDHFKEVNDTLGHHYGDLLLQQVSLRVPAVLRDSDTLARLGGDEFAVLLPTAGIEGATQVADKIRTAVEQPYFLEGHPMYVGASIGIAVYPVHGQEAETLMQRADVAMYVAKRSKVGYSVYASDQDDHSPDRLALRAELRQAIEQKRLLVHYQPKVNLRTSQIEGVEALARWPHPEHGLMLPDQFIPLAEESGLIRPLSYCILDAALRQCRLWQEAHLDLGIAVNLSAENLHDPDLIGVISELLATHRVAPGALTLEITESAIMVDSAQAMETLERLHGMGVRIAIDDFGTGYSSLAYLKRLPVNEIKIDKSFILDMKRHDDDAFIARSVVDLGHNLGLEVVAEGVESHEIWGMLEAMSCDQAQGYYLSHPLPAAEVASWFEQTRPRSGKPARVTKIDEYRRRGRAGA